MCKYFADKINQICNFYCKTERPGRLESQPGRCRTDVDEQRKLTTSCPTNLAILSPIFQGRF